MTCLLIILAVEIVGYALLRSAGARGRFYPGSGDDLIPPGDREDDE